MDRRDRPTRRVRWSFRQAQGGDVDDVRELLREYRTLVDDQGCFEGFEEELARLPGEFEPPVGALLVAYLDGEPAGCVGMRPYAPGVAEIKRLYVREFARGHGIGLALVRRALREALQAGYKRVRLDTLRTMASARRIYDEMGFKEVQSPNGSCSADVVFMERELI